MRLIKVHIGLIKYLKEALIKEKTIKGRIKIFKNVIKSYPIVIKNEIVVIWKSLFDKQFKEEKKKYNNIQKLKKEFQKALKMLHYFDESMKKKGFPSWRRKQFWRDFYKSESVRTEVFEELAKELK